MVKCFDLTANQSDLDVSAERNMFTGRRLAHATESLLPDLARRDSS